ncbi:MAG: hypothetical protein RIC30_14890 [Marinoscillum sp.]|uniref:hypothetical protein n=1 Tax=Marinoscillum sp. TaxID=2024838 RepID=UPI0032F1A942
MRYLLSLSFLTLFLGVSGQSATEESLQVGQLYQFTASKVAANTDQKYVDTTNKRTSYDVSSGYKVIIDHLSDDSVYYSYLNFNDQGLYKTYNTPVTWVMSKKEFKEITRPLYSRYKGAKVGVYTVPFRLRGVGGKGEPFDFESSLSLTANLVFGVGSRKEKHSMVDGSLGLGLTSIALDSLNSDVPENRTASALTISLGLVYWPNEQINIGAFVGWDKLGLKDRSADWIYDGKTWLGLGVNIGFEALTTDENAKIGKN